MTTSVVLGPTAVTSGGPSGGSAGAIVDRIAASLRHDPLYVDPGLRSLLSPAQRQDIEDHLAHAPYPVYVVLYPSADNDVFGGQPEDLLTRLEATGLGHGVYLASGSTLRPDQYGSTVDVHVTTSGVAALSDLDGYALDPIVSTARPPLSLGAAFDRVTGLVARGPDVLQAAATRAQALEEKQYRASTKSGHPADHRSDAGGGSSAGAVTGIVVGVVVVVAVLALLLRRFRGRSGHARPRTFTLPDSALARIRQVHDRRLEETARAELLALGERSERATGTDGVSAALDRYDVARDVIDRVDPPDVLDLVGAIVLVRQGQAALDAAARRRPWTPPRTCFLDPLHGAATVTRVVARETGGDRDVPLCSQCRRDLDAGRDPDILDVERRGRAVHYFDSGVEPWASTGYGCFGDDLVVAWRRAARS